MRLNTLISSKKCLYRELVQESVYGTEGSTNTVGKVGGFSVAGVSASVRSGQWDCLYRWITKSPTILLI